MTTPKPPYTGPFKVINIDFNEPMNYLEQEIFVHAPFSESWQTSTRRLIAAMRADGRREIRPTTIWLTYRRHKELQQHLKSNP